MPESKIIRINCELENTFSTFVCLAAAPTCFRSFSLSYNAFDNSTRNKMAAQCLFQSTPLHLHFIFLRLSKVAILTFWFNLSSSNRLKRQRSEATGIPPNLTYHNKAPWRLPRLSHLCLASLSLRSAVAKPDAAYLSAALNRRPRSKRHQAWRPYNEITLG